MATLDDETSLVASLELYKGQLAQVEACLQTDESSSNLDDLKQLQKDLKEIIHLTEETIALSKTTDNLNRNEDAATSCHLKNSQSSSVDDSEHSSKTSRDVPSRESDKSEDSLNAEYAAFQMLLGEHLTQKEVTEATELSEDDTSDEDTIQIDSSVEDDAIQIDSGEEDEETIEISDGFSDRSENDDKELLEDDMFGHKFQAPFSHSWGQIGYYNAIVLSRVKTDSKGDEPMVEVLFCNPTHSSMRPCPYYLGGCCRFTVMTCRYSHGEHVKISDLRPYQSPDFSKIALGSLCLARDNDDIWYEATIVEIMEEAKFQVQFNANHHLKIVVISDLYPLDHKTEESSQPDDTDDDDGAVASSFSSPAAAVDIKTTEALGDWEAHTKGIGSKLMAKMGYVVGQGLGRNNDGRAEPVPINLLPKGISLDKIMELKSLAKNENLFNAMKKQRWKQKQHFNKKKETANTQTTNSPSVFDFINTKLGRHKGNARSSMKCRSSHTAKDAKFISTKELKDKSDKHLNIQLLKTNEEMKNTEKQILRLKDTLERAIERNDHVVSKEVRRKLDGLANYSNQLRTSEAYIRNQKMTRKTHNIIAKF